MVLIYLVRTILYFSVHAALENADPTHEDHKGFGSFLAEYVESVIGSYILTFFWLIVYIGLYLSNFYIIFLMRRLRDFIET